MKEIEVSFPCGIFIFKRQYTVTQYHRVNSYTVLQLACVTWPCNTHVLCLLSTCAVIKTIIKVASGRRVDQEYYCYQQADPEELVFNRVDYKISKE